MDKEKYEQALERAKEYYEAYEGKEMMAHARGALEYIFPELAESEDEKIRKEIITLVKNTTLDGTDQQNAYLAWLEKKGEPVEINPTEFDIRLRALIGKFDSLPKEELIGSLSFWMNVVQNDGTYKSDEKQGEQKPDWSEEDETILINIIIMLKEGASIHFNKTDITKAVDFLKSLKDRIQPQSKQEWSEEDEKIIHGLIRGLTAKKEIHGHTTFSSDAIDITEAINWLKSLRPQKHWKPSEEQMIALQEAMNIVGILTITGSKINSLYQDLKKLREGKL